MPATLPAVWRINLKTDARPGIDPREFCLSRGCLGVGWAVDGSGSLDWDTYSERARIAHQGDKGWWPALNAVRNRMAMNDLCWTRDTAGLYYLGRVTGPWKYVADQENRCADVVNLRPCDWLRVGPVDGVPGRVVNSFVKSRTVQRVHDRTVQIYSAYLYNTLSSTDFSYDVPPEQHDLFSLLSSEDCEDLVAAYMQLQGYLLLASTCKRSTSAYEFVMRHRDTGERAAAQVKNGFDDLYVEDYATFPGRVFLLTSKGRYVGRIPPNVTCLAAEDVLKFIHNREVILSDRIKTWLSIAGELGRDTDAT